MASQVSEGSRPEFFTEINLIRRMVDKIDPDKKEDLAPSLKALEGRVDVIRQMQWQNEVQKQFIDQEFGKIRDKAIQVKTSLEAGSQDEIIQKIASLKQVAKEMLPERRMANGELRKEVTDLAVNITHAKTSDERQHALQKLRDLCARCALNNIDFESNRHNLAEGNSFFHKILAMEPAAAQVFLECGYEFSSAMCDPSFKKTLLGHLARSMTKSFAHERQLVIDLIKHFHCKGLRFSGLVGGYLEHREPLIAYIWCEHLNLYPKKTGRFLENLLRATEDITPLNVVGTNGLPFLGYVIRFINPLSHNEIMAFIKKLVFWGATITDEQLAKALIRNEEKIKNMKEYLQQCADIRQKAVLHFNNLQNVNFRNLASSIEYTPPKASLTPSVVYQHCLWIEQEQQKQGAKENQQQQAQPPQ